MNWLSCTCENFLEKTGALFRYFTKLSCLLSSKKKKKKIGEEEKNPHWLEQCLRCCIELLTCMVLFVFLMTNNREPIFFSSCVDNKNLIEILWVTP